LGSKKHSLSGSLHPKWKGGLYELICQECGKPFQVYYGRKETAKFCSRSCVQKKLSRDALIAVTVFGIKRCPNCGEIKYVGSFYKHKGTSDGYSAYCKECEKLRRKDYYDKNKDEYLSRQKLWRSEHKERLRKQRRSQYLRNRDRVRDIRKRQQAKYRLENRARIRAQEAISRKVNREKIRSRAKIRAKQDIANLKPYYLKQLLRRRELAATPKIIAFKKEQIMLFRELKTLRRRLDHGLN